MAIEAIIKKHALANALRYGKTDAGKLIGKIIGEMPEIRSKIKEIMPTIQAIVKEVNAMSDEERKHMLEQEFPEMLEKKKEEKDIFANIPIKEGQQVITAFPPDPSKYPHIGHAKAALINYLFAKKHNGKFYLRFEDTNPLLPKKEFYEKFQDHLAWMGIQPDKIFYASDFIDLLYEKIEQFFEQDAAYVCTCDQETVKASREKGIACSCRERSPEENKAFFARMLGKEAPMFQEGEAIVRLKIDLKHKNTTMRDPTVFRIIEHPHPRVGTKYRVWPNYDFQNAILDSHTKVTHRFRTKEFELRSELQKYIQEKAGYEPTFTYEFGRFNLEGVPSSGRIIREMIQSGQLIGWDDPQLHTIIALKRRGFTPEAIKNFLLSTGITKNEATLTWDDLIMHNKRIVDKIAERYFFVEDPIALTIQFPEEKRALKEQGMEVRLKKHPEKEERTRVFHVNDKLLIQKSDYERIEKENELMIRFMDLFNVKKTKEGFFFVDEDYLTYKNYQGPKVIIHWLPEQSSNIPVEIFMPDHTRKQGLGEPSIKDLKEDAIIQFERVGFCRLDKKSEEKLVFWFTHK